MAVFLSPSCRRCLSSTSLSQPYTGAFARPGDATWLIDRTDVEKLLLNPAG
jgi:hypothetical protein